MSKTQQRYKSIFSAGRELFLISSKRKLDKSRNSNKHQQMHKDLKINQKLINKRMRNIFYAGWKSASVGVQSNKIKKVLRRREFALLNRTTKSSY